MAKNDISTYVITHVVGIFGRKLVELIVFLDGQDRESDLFCLKRTSRQFFLPNLPEISAENPIKKFRADQN